MSLLDVEFGFRCSDSEIVQKNFLGYSHFTFLFLSLSYITHHPLSPTPFPLMAGFGRILKYFDFVYVEIVVSWITLESEFNIMQILNNFPTADEMLNIPTMRWKIL